MVYSINRVTYAAALGVAPLVLFGCKNDQPCSSSGQQSGSGALDANGIPEDAPESKRAIGELLGQCIERNFCDGDKPGRDARLIGHALEAVVSYVRQEVGCAKTADKALNNWKTGDDVPGPAKEAINAICANAGEYRVFPNSKLANLEKHFRQEIRDEVTELLTRPATKAIKEFIAVELKKRGVECEQAVNECLGDLGARVDSKFGRGAFLKAAVEWACGDPLPGAVAHALMEWIQEKEKKMEEEKDM